MSNDDPHADPRDAKQLTDEHVGRLRAGVESWNAWRRENPGIEPRLVGAALDHAELAGANLEQANLSFARLDRATLTGAHLTSANLTGAKLPGAALDHARMMHAQLLHADLTGADLSRASLAHADLGSADLSAAKLPGADLDFASLVMARLEKADLSDARFVGANLGDADCTGAILKNALLNGAYMVRTKLNGAVLDGSRIHGISAWDVELDDSTSQNDLVITQKYQTPVMVDDLEVAQFVYLILNREKLRRVINTVTKKGVLILGRFHDGGIELLQSLAAWLRRPENGGYLPILCDFSRPDAKTFTETVRTLAGMARFVIVDLSGPSVPQEITATVDLYEIPFVPILDKSRKDWSMFRDFLVRERVFEPLRFENQAHLFELLADDAIARAEDKVAERQRRLDRIFGSN